MSSVLVKGMEMPYICDCCNFCNIDYSNYRKHCRSLFEDIPWEFGRNGTLPDCPLVEVETPHDRLIDVGEIEMPCLETVADQKWMEIAIKSTPTVIEAEWSE